LAVAVARQPWHGRFHRFLTIGVAAPEIAGIASRHRPRLIREGAPHPAFAAFIEAAQQHHVLRIGAIALRNA